MSVLYLLRKANVVMGSLSMGSVDHVENDKKKFSHDVHRLAQLVVLLVDSNEGGIFGHIDLNYLCVVCDGLKRSRSDTS